LYVYGVVPPEAPIALEYIEPTVPLGSSVVVIVSLAALTVSAKLTVAVCGVGVVESVTVNPTVAVPAVPSAGVPLIAPEDPLIESPLGRLVAVNLYGVVPPLAAIEPL
jgi:hypothetical protein